MTASPDSPLLLACMLHPSSPSPPCNRARLVNERARVAPGHPLQEDGAARDGLRGRVARPLRTAGQLAAVGPVRHARGCHDLGHGLAHAQQPARAEGGGEGGWGRAPACVHQDGTHPSSSATTAPCPAPDNVWVVQLHQGGHLTDVQPVEHL